MYDDYVFETLYASEEINNNNILKYILSSSNNNINNNLKPGKIRSFKIKNENNIYDNNNNNNNNYTTSNFLTFSESLKNKFTKQDLKELYSFRSPYKCLFCNGKDCKWENYKKQESPSIPGLLSDLFLDTIYATQRPSTILINEYNLISEFKSKNIGLIINLQLPGEHPYCGPNLCLEISGFSYNPEIFYVNGIDVKLCGWNDLDVPDTFNYVLDIVKDITYCINVKKKRVLVHCHAGNGRTGLIIVCYLVYSLRYKWEEALKIVREKRWKGVEKKVQEDFCRDFEIYVRFKEKIFGDEKMNVDWYVYNQNLLDYKKDSNKKSYVLNYFYENNNNLDNKKLIYYNPNLINFKYFPIIIYEIFERVFYLKIINNISNKNFYILFLTENDLSEDNKEEIINLINQINQNDFSFIQNSNNLNVLIELFFLWLNNSVINCINYKNIKKIIDLYEKYIINYETFNNVEEGKNVLKFINQSLSNVELNLIKYFSLFIYNICPDLKCDDNEEKKYFNYMLIKIIIFLLGFNFDKILESENNKNFISENVFNLFKLIEFFIYYNKKENNNIKEENLSNEKNDNLYNLYLKLKNKFENNENFINEDNFFNKNKKLEKNINIFNSNKKNILNCLFEK